MTEVSATLSNPTADDPRARLLASPMSKAQVAAVAVTFALCALDGYDVLSITFAAPAIAQSLGVGKAEIGYIFTSGLLGMAAGSLLIAPAADVLGRRRLIFLSLAIMLVGTAWTAVSTGLGDMIASRVLTGLGIGSMIAVINSLAAEYANAKRRELSISLLNIGYPLGGVAGGLMAASLIPIYGWRSLFVIAVLATVVMALVVWKFLPEPIAYIIARPKADSLERVNGYLKRCGMEPCAALPPPPTNAEKAPMGNLFRDGMASVTLTIMAIYFFYVVTLFFVQSWIPSMVASLGFSTSVAALVSVSVTVGGVFGGLTVGVATGKIGLKATAILFIVLGTISTAVFGMVPADTTLLRIAAFTTGFFMMGGMISLYGVIARTFPAHMRASGTGFVIGLGRIGSAIGPLVAGLLFAGGLTGQAVASIMAIPAVVALLGLLAFKVKKINEA